MIALPRPAHADDPAGDLRGATEAVQRAGTAARTGDLATAGREYAAFENRWFEIEDGIRAQSRDAYRAIERQMGAVSASLAATPADPAAVLAALAALQTENEAFIAGKPPVHAPAVAAPAAQPSAEPERAPTVGSLLDALAATRSALHAGDFDGARQAYARFDGSWTDVEGEIKTRSADDYRATENDMARLQTALGASAAGDALRLVDTMSARLQPYVDAGNYTAFDAMIIVLREGLEALLVVVALLAFVRKSGNADKDGWVWGGALGGLLASIALGAAIHILLGKAFSGENRELLEGITGLIAAGMLLYVSYWLHSKSLLGEWERYIGAQTTRALARGSLLGLATLSFLAVFREGGETVLFLFGLSGRITTESLVLGLGIGFVLLGMLGFLLIVVGLRVRMRPFFATTSVLTFYLCFKFVGSGLHALQVSGVLPARTAEFLPENDWLGLFPSWQTTVPQTLLLLLGAYLVVRNITRDRALRTALHE